MKNDRELLELAAKAIGFKYTKPTEDYDGSLGLEIGSNPMRTQSWNPLKDASDRYNLAQRLGLAVDFTECTVWKRCSDHSLIQEYWGGECGDEAHAIVRAAAKIGKTLE